MEPERWQAIERIYHAALECDESQRTSYLEKACASDLNLRSEVESLLQYAQRPAKYFEKPALEIVARALAENLLAEDLLTADQQSSDGTRTDKMMGATIAQYRIVGKLGAGGMGDIYRAGRADDSYQKEVAIKLVRQGPDTEFAYARFRKERQILAGFEHENIARLLDGGTTDEGHPFFVMELVEGKPIDQYCDEHQLTTAARLALFQSVCSAVQYAHQRLVVHRDIKPSNILVTADGVVKLLDFGIATILSPDPASPEAAPTLTLAGERMMTPQFASPEQLRGEVITTATDVYSLGMVLYKLLTGHLPYRVDNNSPFELAHAICETEPEKPSTIIRHEEKIAVSRSTSPDKLRRVLSGDLDQILLKALRKEPQRRYASVQDFAEDLRAYTIGLPVSARGDAFSYRAEKFIRRHKLLLAATAIFALVVLAAAVAIVREARIARMQQARAERRFNDVRRLANALLFDIHDSIRDLPGSTSARKLLVDRALQYLDSLSQEGSATPDLERELASAYERVGDVQGNPYFANLGDTAGAIESYRKALRIRTALAGEKGTSPADQAALSTILVKLSLGLRTVNDFPAALQALQQAYPISSRLTAEQPTPEAQEALASVSFAMAQCLADTGDIAGSLDYYRKSAAIREGITGGSPAFQAMVQTRLAGVYGYMAGIMDVQGDVDSALSFQSKSRDILDRQIKSGHGNPRFEQYLLESEYWVGFYLADKGLTEQALSHFRIALTGFQKLTDADAHDALAMRYLGKCYMSQGRTLAAQGKTAEGIRSVRQGIRILETLVSADRADTNFKLTDLAYARSILGEIYSNLAAQPGASTAAKITSWREARFWYQYSLDLWMQLSQKAPLARSDATKPDKVRAEIARCNDALAKLDTRH
jgi:serine/threonine protein kinase